MKFKGLYIGQVFEFTNTFPGMKRGPWVKISARRYRLNTNPFSVDINERMEHQTWVNLICEVGSINAEVNPLNN